MDIGRLRNSLQSVLKVVIHKSTSNPAHLPLVSVVAALSGALVLGYRQVDDSGHKDQSLRVITWNVLARPYTKYNSQQHRASAKLEDENQTKQRYTLAGEELVGRAADVVFLQECESDFFEPRWNLAASKLEEAYYTYRCNVGDSPGTAVLVKKTGQATCHAERPLCIGGTEETGGDSKVATLMQLMHGGKMLTAASIHFRGGPQADVPVSRRKHADLILDGLTPETEIVLGGDFNCNPGDQLDNLEVHPLFRDRLKRLPLQQDAKTGLSADMSREEILDYIYVSQGLEVLRSFATAKPRPPWAGNATKPAKVYGASDHVPVFAEIKWKTTATAREKETE
mmetsp:Transcript_74201/g.143637  ORF Transcript_74201/g.143637 Transcript_74201/m.143637 type:complete len:340 (+) Transcript_74201:57-1076(+)